MKNNKKSKKTKTNNPIEIKKGVLNPVIPQFGKKNQFREQDEINPTTTFTPVQDRSGTRGDRV